MQEKFSQINTHEDVRNLLTASERINLFPDILKNFIKNGFKAELIKQNPKRKVFRLENKTDSFYLKIFQKQIFPFCILRFYPEKEFDAAKKLQKNNIPVINYLAWGKIKEGGFCISEGIKALPARQFFFSTLIHDPQKTEKFLNNLALMVKMLHEKNFIHPDLHLGNILVRINDEKLFLPDPWGIKQKSSLKKIDKAKLAVPWMELRGSLPDEVLIRYMKKTNMTTPENTENLFGFAAKIYNQKFNHNKKKLSTRILSGKSKFATAVKLENGLCHFRHSNWFSPPENMTIEQNWKMIEFDSIDESKKIWLDSFLKQPPENNPPQAWLIRNDGKANLYYRIK